MQTYCSYYQAHVKKSEILFLVATLKSFDHMCFDRAFDPQANQLEFFVPQAYESLFLRVMNYFEKAQIVSDLQKLPNRLMREGKE